MDQYTVTDQSKCPICFEIPTKEIYQCINGHVICSGCCASVNSCPQCRLPYGEERIRNRALEDILDAIDFECFYKNHGCNTLSGRSELENHIQNCPYREEVKDICKLVGYTTCNFLTKFDNLSESIQHFQDAHDMIVCHEQRGFIHMTNFMEVAPKISNFFWTPIILGIQEEVSIDDPVFLVWSKVNMDHTLSWMFLCLGKSSQQASNLQLEIKIKNTSNEMPQLKWKVPPINCLMKSDVLQTDRDRIPLSLLTRYYVVDGDLTASFKLVGDKATRMEDNANLNEEHIWRVSRSLEHIAEGTSMSDTQTNIHLPSNFGFVICNGCNISPIVGSQMKCLLCPDYNLCRECFDEGSLHLEHVFGLIDDLEKLEGLRVILENPLPYLCGNASQIQNENTVYAGVGCDGCSQTPIAGVRYKCLQCQDYDLCCNCLQSGLHRHHIFAVIRNSHNNVLIRSFSQDGFLLME